MSNLEELIQAIKKKKELQHLNDQFVKEQVLAYFKKNPAQQEILNKKLNPKSKIYKEIVKTVRANLRRVYGLFRSEEGIELRKKIVEQLSNAPTSKIKKIVTEILQTHASTKERLHFYDKLYKKIFKITKKPNVIIDLGCGINPFSIPYMNYNNLSYYAYDLNESEIALINKFFKIIKVKGKAEVLNILKTNKLVTLPKAEVCFLFKITDVLDQGRGHKTSENVIKNIPAKFVVVSFPTFTMSGKKMNFPRRKWIELMSERLGYNYKVLEFSNEIFYIIKKDI